MGKHIHAHTHTHMQTRQAHTYTYMHISFTYTYACIHTAHAQTHTCTHNLAHLAHLTQLTHLHSHATGSHRVFVILLWVWLVSPHINKCYHTTPARPRRWKVKVHRTHRTCIPRKHPARLRESESGQDGSARGQVRGNQNQSHISRLVYVFVGQKLSSKNAIGSPREINPLIADYVLGREHSDCLTAWMALCE